MIGCIYKPMCHIVHHRNRIDKNRKNPRAPCVADEGYNCPFDSRREGARFAEHNNVIYLPLSKETWDMFSKYDIEKTPEEIIIELVRKDG